MSGVEVAGLVLGAFPLIISALDHYRETAETLGVFWKIRREYKIWMHSLNFCKLAFEQNLEEFLLPLIAEEDELRRLMEEPGGPEWQKPELDERLRQRLPRSYELYLESIERITDVMDELKHELGMDKSGFQSRVSEQITLQANSSKPALLSTANFEFQTQRIKLSFNLSRRDKLFKELTDYNNELRTLLDTSDRIAALRQNRGPRKRSADLKGLWQFWRHADGLYNLLTQSWRCECRTLHQANLMLQHRTTPKADFRVTFVYAPQNSKPEAWSWTCQETNIKMLPDEWQPKKSTVSFATVTPITSTGSIPSRTPSQTDPTYKAGSKKSLFRVSIMGKFKKKGKHQSCQPSIPGQKAPAVSATVTLPIPGPQIIVTDTSNPTSDGDETEVIEIVSLCDTIAKFRSNLKRRCCLKGEQFRFAISPIESAERTAYVQDTVSLGSLLRKDSKIIVTRRQRYLIALTIASSYLQLHSTPWISPHWSKKDILFLRDNVNPDKIHLEQPYVSRNFRPDHASNNDNDHSNGSLSNLGIMLLELCFGTALEDHELRQKYPQGVTPNRFLDMAAALEWSRRAVEEAGPEFADAILWCLRNMPGSGQSDDDGMSLGDWREELFVKVVQPLKGCYDLFVSVGR